LGHSLSRYAPEVVYNKVIATILMLFLTFLIKSAIPNLHLDHLLFFFRFLVLQYGFVTMFVAAFPLAPIFALLNSIVEIRVDAINFVRQFRRPDIAIAEDIGAWYRILESLTKLSVLINAFVLSFTSDFVPRLLYKMKYAPDRDMGGTLNGYLNASLSYFEVKYFDDWERDTKPEYPMKNLNYTRDVCRYVQRSVRFLFQFLLCK